MAKTVIFLVLRREYLFFVCKTGPQPHSLQIINFVFFARSSHRSNLVLWTWVHQFYGSAPITLTAQMICALRKLVSGRSVVWSNIVGFDLEGSDPTWSLPKRKRNSHSLLLSLEFFSSFWWRSSVDFKLCQPRVLEVGGPRALLLSFEGAAVSCWIKKVSFLFTVETGES